MLHTRGPGTATLAIAIGDLFQTLSGIQIRRCQAMQYLEHFDVVSITPNERRSGSQCISLRAGVICSGDERFLNSSLHEKYTTSGQSVKYIRQKCV